MGHAMAGALIALAGAAGIVCPADPATLSALAATTVATTPGPAATIFVESATVGAAGAAFALSDIWLARLPVLQTLAADPCLLRLSCGFTPAPPAPGGVRDNLMSAVRDGCAGHIADLAGLDTGTLEVLEEVADLRARSGRAD